MPGKPPSIVLPKSRVTAGAMDITDLQTRLNEFMMNSALSGACDADEMAALKKDLEGVIEAHGDDLPELAELAAAFETMATVVTDPSYRETMAALAMKDYVPNPAIFDAIDDGDVDAVNAALADWQVNAMHGEFDKTALYHAMAHTSGLSIPVVTVLLDAGADPRLGLGETSNVLHGLGFGQCDGVAPADLAAVITRCVALGADIEQRSNRLGWTPLIMAASEWNPVATEALLLAGADIQARAGDVDGVCFAGETALAFADGHDATRAVIERYLNGV